MFNSQSPFRVKPQLDPGLWHWMMQFARRCTHAQVLRAGKSLQTILDASMEEYRQLLPSLSADSEWRENGLLYVLQTQRGLEDFARHDDLTTKHFGVQSKRLSGTELANFDDGFVPNLAGAFWYPGDGSVSPEGLNQAWLASTRAQGVAYIEDCQVHSVLKDSGRVVGLETDQGELSADQFVFALGHGPNAGHRASGAPFRYSQAKVIPSRSRGRKTHPNIQLYFQNTRSACHPLKAQCVSVR